MLHYPQLLLVGGTGRNVGKTEFICRLISRIAVGQKIYALKVSAVYPDEQIYHGDHGEAASAFEIYEEIRRDSHKDSSRMLRAGAERVFYLRSDTNTILQGFRQCMEHIPDDAPLVCESNTLGDCVRPGLMTMVTSTDGIIKERAKPLIRTADLVIKSDCRSGFKELERIYFDTKTGWQIL